jgi:hypothetical protein
MKSPIAMFKRDPAALLARDRAALASARAKLADLERDRANLLLSEDGYEVVRRADLAAAEQVAAVAILESRIKALGLEVRKVERLKLEQARDKAVAEVIVPQFGKIEQLALKLEQAVVQLGEAYGDLRQASRDLNSDWPSSVPKPRFWQGNAFSLLDITGRLAVAMQYAANGRDFTQLFEHSNLERSETIAQMVRRLFYLTALYQVEYSVVATM